MPISVLFYNAFGLFAFFIPIYIGYAGFVCYYPLRPKLFFGLYASLLPFFTIMAGKFKLLKYINIVEFILLIGLLIIIELIISYILYEHIASKIQLNNVDNSRQKLKDNSLQSTFSSHPALPESTDNDNFVYNGIRILNTSFESADLHKKSDN